MWKTLHKNLQRDVETRNGIDGLYGGWEIVSGLWAANPNPIRLTFLIGQATASAFPEGVGGGVATSGVPYPALEEFLDNLPVHGVRQ